MRKKQLWILFFLLPLRFLSANEEGVFLSRLYQYIPDIKQKYAIMQNLIILEDPSLEPTVSAALNDLVYGESSQYQRQKSSYDDWEILTRMIIMELGEMKSKNSTEAIWDIVQSAETPLLKAAALIAIGNISAVEHAEEVAIILRNINFNKRPDKENAEKEAYAALISLDKLRQEVGFAPVFYAAIGWYDDRVTDYAQEVLFRMVDDPAESLINVMRESSDYNHKLEAFTMTVTSDASDAKKTEASVAALDEGLRYKEVDPLRREKLTILRKAAMRNLLEKNLSSSETAELINTAVDRGNLDEKILGLQTLGVDGSEKATELLVQRLKNYNERQLNKINLNKEEQVIFRQTIFALSETKNEKAVPVLREIAFIGYSSALVTLSQEAIKKIKGEKE